MLFGHGDDFTNLELEGNFSSNVWYGADTGGLREYLYGKFHSLGRYPEPDSASLREVLARQLGVSAGNILVTNGSITALYMVAQAWAGRNSAILIPSFAEYEDACVLHRHRITFIRNDAGLAGLRLEGQDLCWICNPNNPDGRWWGRDVMLAFLRLNRNTCVVVDQAYDGFVEDEGLSPADTESFPNLLLVRSISKVCRIPGMRIGYIVGDQGLISVVRRYLVPWSVSALAIEAGKYVVQHRELSVLPLGRWKKDAEDLKAALSRFPGLEVLPSETPFFLVRLTQGRAAGLKRYLLEEHRLLIRDASNFRGLGEEYFRLCAQSPEANGKLLEALRLYFSR